MKRLIGTPYPPMWEGTHNIKPTQDQIKPKQNHTPDGESRCSRCREPYPRGVLVRGLCPACRESVDQ